MVHILNKLLLVQLKELIVQNDITITIDLHESLINYLNLQPYIGNQVIAGNPKISFLRNEFSG